MLSWRLWQTLSEPAYKNPIFKRISNDRRRFATGQASIRIPSYVRKLVLALIILAIIRTPYILLLLFQIPAIVITLIVITPVLLPYIIMVYGAYLVSKITTIIHKEKRQYTYDLLCASPDGALRTNWILATGIIHRGDWFYWVEALGNFTYRVGQIILLGLASLTLLAFLFTEAPLYMESLQTLISLSLILVLYYTSFIQTFVLILLVGLYATSLELNQRDSNVIGLVLYIILQCLPYLIAITLYLLLHALLPNPQPVLAIGVDCIVLGSISVTQEVNITLIWYRLTKRLNATTSSYVVGRIAPLHS